ncbi:hypothetical protein KM043_002758 [Ampulex compressa]|nr:hypothetical protein KM043_002758 [Ampulex compressa]
MATLNSSAVPNDRGGQCSWLKDLRGLYYTAPASASGATEGTFPGKTVRSSFPRNFQAESARQSRFSRNVANATGGIRELRSKGAQGSTGILVGQTSLCRGAAR